MYPLTALHQVAQWLQLSEPVVIKTETPFEWVNDHIHLVGWPVLIFVCWQLRGIFERFKREHTEAIKTLMDTQEIARQTKVGVDLIQSNHLAHLKSDMAGLQQETSKTIEILSSIDRNIAVLVDREGRK